MRAWERGEEEGQKRAGRVWDDVEEASPCLGSEPSV